MVCNSSERGFFMNAMQKREIERLRLNSFSYSYIAKQLNINLNTIKAHFRRNSLAQAKIDIEDAADPNRCKHCGKKLNHTPKAKPKKFCCEFCRHRYWNAHRDQMKRKAFYFVDCAHCGKLFESYGNAGRKYCSHECYINHRFGEPGKQNEAPCLSL